MGIYNFQIESIWNANEIKKFAVNALIQFDKELSIAAISVGRLIRAAIMRRI